MKQPKAAILDGWSHAKVMNLMLKIGTRAQLPLTRGKPYIRNRKLPLLKSQTRWRSLPALARATVARPAQAGGAERWRPADRECGGRVEGRALSLGA
jgi:hypothetical protein